MTECTHIRLLKPTLLCLKKGKQHGGEQRILTGEMEILRKTANRFVEGRVLICGDRGAETRIEISLFGEEH